MEMVDMRLVFVAEPVDMIISAGIALFIVTSLVIAIMGKRRW